MYMIVPFHSDSSMHPIKLVDTVFISTLSLPCFGIMKYHFGVLYAPGEIGSFHGYIADAKKTAIGMWLCPGI